MTNSPYHNSQPPYAGAKAGGDRFSPGQKTGAILGGVLLTFVLFCCGGLGVIGAFAPDPEPTPATLDAAGLSGRTGDGSISSQADGTTTPSASASATPSPTPSASATTAAPTPTPTSTTAPPSPAPPPSPAVRQPKVETKTVTETQQIPFQEKRVNDATLPKGTTKVKTNGVAGVKKLTYQVTYTNGVQTAKKLISEQVTKQPVTKVVLVGTKVAQQCHPSYTGACVPIASDVDCAGGSGNGPAYVQGPVRVIGQDVYDLDRDGDGVACE
ncbi:G5 domain-containing protein [Solwaraspora sp. WMMD406]|uniref:G5 domain-containing protein n=1 Tax=Solwaraspora sp. WMMD406 TaxID=3016095 RepID=UPI002417B381|nr:G5 domain-containing protein [Solwaraspora sp. WMMD406]MDG4762788.1 G5 domain-containing protein [Solwaraspora sp. WMMD406]